MRVLAPLLALAPAVFSVSCQSVRPPDRPPNFILIYADDLGYGDLGCFGSQKNRTPNLDRMATEGMRLTSFYSTSGVCTPSRTSLMTGCYPRRVNMHVDAGGRWVLFPNAKKGLHPDEVTVAEVLRDRGYATGCIGKWHLGDQREFLPTRQGFQSYFGIPYSNDMNRKGIPLPLMRDEEVIEAPAEQTTLTPRYTAEAVSFIAKNKHRPFFLYLPHTFPHLPLFASPRFKGKSKNGRYGDTIEEIDWSMGEIFKALKEHGIDERTLVVFTSDNGSNGRNGGSNAPLRGRKGQTNEGGMRVPCVVRWPGHVAPGTRCDEVAATLDILPTFARLAGTAPDKDRTIDGKDITALLTSEPGAKSPHDAFYYYHLAALQAVRIGKWKYVLPRTQRQRRQKRTVQLPAKLFDLSKDIHEDTNLAEKRPDVIASFAPFVERARRELGDGKIPGVGQRPAGMVTNPKPLLQTR